MGLLQDTGPNSDAEELRRVGITAERIVLAKQYRRRPSHRVAIEQAARIHVKNDLKAMHKPCVRDRR